jgi:tetratricopeptide (TPR) repeat protein
VGSHRPRGRLSGIEIDPAALRQVRLQAGLSLAQLGGAELTRQAVHLIETGKARPSKRSLRILASRLGVPESWLLVQPDGEGLNLEDRQVGELEDLCQRHEYLSVLERGQEALDRGESPRLLAFASHFMGQALYRLARPDEALQHLCQARRLFDSLGNPWFAAESLDWEAMALNRKEDPDALPAAEEALRRYRLLEPRRPSTEARMLEHIGTIFYGRREHQAALVRYDEALRVGGAVSDLARVGRIYHGQGMCFEGLGDLRKARELLLKAVALHEVEHRMSPVPARNLLPRAENDLALVLMKQGDMDRADQLFRSALGHFAEAGTERAQSHVLLSLGELRQRQGRINEAVHFVQQAIELAERFDETLALAAGYEQLARLNAARGDDHLAEAGFQRALRLLESAGLEERRRACASAYARVRAERNGGPAEAERLG